MKKLLSVAILNVALGLLACGGGKKQPTPSVVAVATATEVGTSAESGACHIGNFDEGADILFEDDHLCIAHYTSSGVYQVRIIATDVGAYKGEKLIAEGKIQEKAPDQKCRFVWAPSEKLPDLTSSDLITSGCNGVPAGGK